MIAFFFRPAPREIVQGSPKAAKFIHTYTPSEADKAFLQSDYDRAVTLYQAQLQQKPGDPALIASLAQVFLRQQKVKEADDIVQKALDTEPSICDSVDLARRGTVPRGNSVACSEPPRRPLTKIDICYPAAASANAPAFPAQLLLWDCREGDCDGSHAGSA